MHQPQDPRRIQGFTLVELLACVAILGILAVVLLPNLLNARRYSNEGASVAYLRHCVTAIESMRDLNNQKLPDISSCEDPLLMEARLSRPTAVSGTVVDMHIERDDYTITVNSITGKLFYHNGRTVIAGS